MKQTSPITVLIVDDHGMVRSGLSTFLAAYDDLDMVGEASNGEEAVELCKELRPDVVLMDMVMPAMNGVQATECIRRECPNTQVIALTSFPEENMVTQALEAGAISYLLKSVPADELAEAIRQARMGHSTLAPEATQALLYAATHPHRLGQDLTDRERQILPLLAQGLNNGQIAKKLVVSQSTVRFHVSNILAKLGVSSRVEAVALAMRYKLVG